MLNHSIRSHADVTIMWVGLAIHMHNPIPAMTATRNDRSPLYLVHWWHDIANRLSSLELFGFKWWELDLHLETIESQKPREPSSIVGCRGAALVTDTALICPSVPQRITQGKGASMDRDHLSRGCKSHSHVLQELKVCGAAARPVFA